MSYERCGSQPAKSRAKARHYENHLSDNACPTATGFGLAYTAHSQEWLCHQTLQLDVADLHGRIVLAMAALNLILVCFLELKDGQFLCAALFNNFAGDAGLGGIVASENLLVIGMHAQHGAELDLFAHYARYAFHTNGVAGSDTVLLSPGLDYGVHHSSRPKDKP